MSVDPCPPTDADVAAAAMRGACDFPGHVLPSPLPAEPMALCAQWLNDAARSGSQPNPNAMTIATVGRDGAPSARIVLARGFDAARGYIVFYTNYDSRKGEELVLTARAALVFHWDHLGRQIRIEGPVTRSPADESDAYFASRPAMSRIGAWASDQSKPIASRDELLRKNAEAEARFGVSPAEPRDESGAPAAGVQQRLVVPRPHNWGGYRVWAARVELWLGHPARLHDRALWTRTLSPATVDGAPGFTGGTWSVTRLQP